MTTVKMSDEERAAVAGGTPVTVVDEQSQEIYYLISAAEFDRIRAMLASEEFQPSDLYPLISKSAQAAGWDDPIMDEYDRFSGAE